MILIVDNNIDRGINILKILKRNKCDAIHYKFVTGNFEKFGDWNDLKSEFESIIGSNTILFIHKSNSRSEDAARVFLEKRKGNRVVFYSGGGNFTIQIKNQNCFAFQGKVSDDAKTEWDLENFANVLSGKHGVSHEAFEALIGNDETLERLLEQFQLDFFSINTNEQGDVVKETKIKLQTYVKNILARNTNNNV